MSCRWNAQSVKAHQFVGKRAQALKLLLEVAPVKVLDDILDHVQSLGWGSAVWSEDVFASKKVFPGFQFSSKSKRWVPRIKTTDASFELMVRRVQNTFEDTSKDMHFKISVAQAEALSERAAACLALAAELQLQVPVPVEKIKDAFIEAWAMGSDHVDTELQAALLDKSDSFDVTLHMPTLKKIVEDHVFSAPVSLEADARAALDVDTFQLLLKQLVYDQSVYETWQRKCGSVLSVRYHREQDWRGLLWVSIACVVSDPRPRETDHRRALHADSLFPLTPVVGLVLITL